MSHLTIQTHFNGELNHPNRRGGEGPTLGPDVWRQFGGFCWETEYLTEVKWNFVCRSFLQRSLWLAEALNALNWLNETISAVWLEALDVEKLLYFWNDGGFSLEILTLHICVAVIRTGFSCEWVSLCKVLITSVGGGFGVIGSLGKKEGR